MYLFFHEKETFLVTSMLRLNLKIELDFFFTKKIYCSKFLQRLYQNRTRNQPFIILIVLFVDVIFLCVVDTNETPRPFAQKPSIPFLKFLFL